MASTKKITANYSPLLNGMAEYVGRYSKEELSEGQREELYCALQVFFLNNTQKFRSQFLQKAGMHEYGDKDILSLPPSGEYSQFVDHLSSIDGECIFLLKDTWKLMRDYQEKTGKGFGMLINRHFLEEKDQEEGYFELIAPIYQALEGATNLESFLEKYEEKIQELISGNPHWHNRAEQIAQYAMGQAKEKIVWVDMGFQFTFILFCWASVRHYFGEKAPDQDFIMFAGYPWLTPILQEKIFSKRCAGAVNLEHEGIAAYQEALRGKSAGMIVGFAIGDALGFPAAGINLPDLQQMIQLPINGFANNPRHPYFGHLKEGQFTDNSNTLALTAEHLVKHGKLDLDSYSEELVQWVGTKQIDRVTDRWLGPTAQQAIQNLSEGMDWQFSGSTTTESCSSLYRVLPLGITHRPFNEKVSQYLAKTAEELGSITHNSSPSRTGAAIVALIIGNLTTGSLPLRAVRGALNSAQGSHDANLLIEKINRAIEYASQGKSDGEAREFFGAGSPVWQTLPLTIFYFLKHSADFKAGVLAAANSYRSDSTEEQARISALSWEEQVIEAKGGNSDGVAGLTGAFLGTHLGFSSIPQDLLSIENMTNFKKLGEDLLDIKASND